MHQSRNLTTEGLRQFWITQKFGNWFREPAIGLQALHVPGRLAGNVRSPSTGRCLPDAEAGGRKLMARPFVCYDKNSLMLRFETAGESHGECLVATLTGLPAGIPISLDAVNRELWRRQQGYGRGGRMKIETDRAEIVAGVRHSHTIGSPIAILIRNKDWQNWTEVLPVEDYRRRRRHARSP